MTDNMTPEWYQAQFEAIDDAYAQRLSDIRIAASHAQEQRPDEITAQRMLEDVYTALKRAEEDHECARLQVTRWLDSGLTRPPETDWCKFFNVGKRVFLET